MTLLVFGKTGQVARELARLRPNAMFLDRSVADLTDPASCAKAIQRVKPEAIINAAAYTAVDQAEDDEATAELVNAQAPRAMALAALKLGVPFVHLSTDYVFDGAGDTPYTPDHPTGPIGAYGRTKLAGEDHIRAVGGTYAILRTSWVVSAHGGNFVKSMLKLGADRDLLTIVADQIGGPTCAADIAAACITIVDQLRDAPDRRGTYHFSGGPDVSWADFARRILARADLKCAVKNIPSSDYPTRANRPENSRLDMSQTTNTFGIARPDWRIGLDKILDELGAAT